MDWLEDLRYSPAAWFVVAAGCLLMAVFCAGIAVVCATGDPSYPEGAVFMGAATIVYVGCVREAMGRALRIWRRER